MKVFISTFPYARYNSAPLDLLREAGLNVELNPNSRKLEPAETARLASDSDIIIAGTENLIRLVASNNNLRLISRVGIGLDNVPLELCRSKNIKVCYTPDAVTAAVAEMAVGLMIAGQRHLVRADREIRSGQWSRFTGNRLGKSRIGIIGLGRVGGMVADLLSAFHPTEILVHDIIDKSKRISGLKAAGADIRQCSLPQLQNLSDIITLHLPLYAKTQNLADEKFFKALKDTALFINTSRGAIVDETALLDWLIKNSTAAAALDVFSHEPYKGGLTQLENVILTEHMGSCSFDCREAMEMQAAEAVIEFIHNRGLSNEVPEEEYIYR